MAIQQSDPAGTTVQQQIDDGTELLNKSQQQQKSFLTSNTDIENDTLEYDLGLLMASDFSQLDDTLLYNSNTAEQYIQSITQSHCQLIINHLFSLPSTAVPNDTGRIITLPTPLLRLPREKPIPQQKQPTKWEQFATAKGIHKKSRRDRLVYDENTDTYKARFGRDKANDDTAPIIIEHKESPNNTADSEVIDPWTKADMDKAARKQKNKKQHGKNVEYHSASGVRIPGTIDLGSASINANINNKKLLSHSDKITNNTHVDNALNIVQNSTASMGRFDKVHPDQPEPKRRHIKQDAQLQHNAAAEKQLNMNVLENIFGRDDRGGEKERTSLNVDKAVRQVKSTQDSENRKKKYDSNSQRGGKGYRGRK